MMNKWQTYTPLATGFKRYRCSVQYKGTTYSGWQSSSDAHVPSIQECLYNAFDRFIGEGNHINLKGSSRTDKGVHAIKNVFQIDLMRRKRHTGELHDKDLDINNIKEGLNYYLYPETNIKITEVSLVDEMFDSRRNALSRTYIYRIISQHSNLNTTMFHNDTAWILKPGIILDIELMQQAANLLIGEHDFSAFRNSGCQSVSAMRFVSQLDINQLTISSIPTSLSSSATFTSATLPISLASHPFLPQPLSISPQPSTDLLLDGANITTITITANSFLLKMVRNIVGLLVEVGKKKINIKEFERLFHTKDRTQLKAQAPAQGLYLQNVQYD